MTARTLLLLLLVTAARAAPETEVDGARALATVQVLSNDDMRGRMSGLEGGRKAEEWVAGQLARMGLRPGAAAGASWFQQFTGTVMETRPGAIFVASGGKPAPREGKYHDDFVALGFSGDGDVEADVVYVGYGVHAPDRGRDDYAGLDVTGRIVMAIRGLPPDSPLEEERFIGYKSSTARDRGAIGFLLVQDEAAQAGTIQAKYHRKDLPAAWIGRKAADDLFARAGRPNLAAQVKAANGGGNASFALDGVRARLAVHGVLHENMPMRNVVALWPGTSDEYVVLGAHLDHVGVDAVGNVYNGADDNASGSAMLLEVARAVAATGKTFRRNLLFVWFAAEEQGLLGSERFVEEPCVPPGKIALMLNADMVGQGQAALGVGGADLFPREVEALGGLAVEGIERSLHPGGGGSDHWAFQARGVPAFFVHTRGPHPNYHTPHDDWDRIRPELLQAAGRYVRTIAERAADADQPFCRPNRYGEYLWHAAPVVDLSGSAPEEGKPAGIDLRLRRLGGAPDDVLNAIDRILTRAEAKNAPFGVYRPGDDAGALARSMRPTCLLAVCGKPALSVFGPAHRLGAAIFAPYAGSDPATSAGDLWELARLASTRPALISLEGAPAHVQGAAVSTIPAPLLVPADRAEGWVRALRARKRPWVAVQTLGPGAEAGRIRELRELFGAAHLLLVPEDAAMEPPAALLEALHAAGMDRRAVELLLGGNFLALLRSLKQ